MDNKKIDDFMRTTAGKNIPDSGEVKVSPNMQILGEYLTGFSAPPIFEKGVLVRPTADIIADLQEMAELTHEEVNAAMLFYGFRPGRNSSGSFGWLMRPE